MHVFILCFCPESKEAGESGCLFLEFLDPLVEHGEGELSFAALVRVAAVDHDRVEVTPLRHTFGQTVLLPHLGLPLTYSLFDTFDQVEKLRCICLVGVEEGHDARDVVLVFLLGTDLTLSPVGTE